MKNKFCKWKLYETNEKLCMQTKKGFKINEKFLTYWENCLKIIKETVATNEQLTIRNNWKVNKKFGLFLIS